MKTNVDRCCFTCHWGTPRQKIRNGESTTLVLCHNPKTARPHLKHRGEGQKQYFQPYQICIEYSLNYCFKGVTFKLKNKETDAKPAT